jgi:hypothetical protein
VLELARAVKEMEENIMMQSPEQLRTNIEILELREVDCDWMGELLGYFAKGHFDAVEFVDAVNTEYETDTRFTSDQVQHEYWVERPFEPDEPDCDCTCFENCLENAEGAIAVTFVER